MQTINLTQAGQTSEYILAPGGSRVTLSGSGYIKFSPGTIQEAKSGLLTFRDWPIGSTAGFCDLAKPVVMYVVASGSCTVTVADGVGLANDDEVYWVGADPVGESDSPLTPVLAGVDLLNGRHEFQGTGQFHPAIEALRLHVAARLPISYDLMTSAPTITIGTANASSTISGAVNIPITSPLIAESARCVTGSVFPDTTLRLPRYLDGQASGTSAAFTAGLVCAWSICTDSADVEYRTKGTGYGTNGRVWVTENGVRKMAGSLPQLPSDGSFYWVKISFGTAAFRKIEVELSGDGFGGFNVTSVANVGQSILRGPHVLIPGDSFSEGTGAVGYHDGYASRLLRILGVEKSTVSGIGGTGYGATNLGAKKSLLERLQNDVISLAPDVVIHANGLNDTLAQVTTNAPLVFDAISASLPNTAQIVFAPFNPRSVDVEARRAALQSICAARGILFIDSVTQKEITGTGYKNGKTGDGNSDIVIGGTDGADPTHPTPYGHGYIADWRAAALIRAIAL